MVSPPSPAAFNCALKVVQFEEDRILVNIGSGRRQCRVRSCERRGVRCWKGCRIT